VVFPYKAQKLLLLLLSKATQPIARAEAQSSCCFYMNYCCESKLRKNAAIYITPTNRKGKGAKP